MSSDDDNSEVLVTSRKPSVYTPHATDTGYVLVIDITSWWICRCKGYYMYNVYCWTFSSFKNSLDSSPLSNLQIIQVLFVECLGAAGSSTARQLIL